MPASQAQVANEKAKHDNRDPSTWDEGKWASEPNIGTEDARPLNWSSHGCN